MDIVKWESNTKQEQYLQRHLYLCYSSISSPLHVANDLSSPFQVYISSIL